MPTRLPRWSSTPPPDTAGVAVGETRHETVRRFLADIAGRQDDALRVVVAQPEDRISELVRKHGIDAERRQIEIARLDDRPIAAVDLHLGIAASTTFAGISFPRYTIFTDVILRGFCRSSSSFSATTACFTVMK